MSAHKGITNKFGLTTPSSSYAHETSRKISAEWIYTPNESGVTVEIDAIPFVTHEVSMKGVGLPDFSLVSAATSAAGTLKILSIKRSESNRAKKTFEITARKRVNLS